MKNREEKKRKSESEREKREERKSERGKGATSSLVANDIGDPCCALASLDVGNFVSVDLTESQ